MNHAVDEFRQAIETLRADASRVAGETAAPDMERLWTGKAIAYETVLGAMNRIWPKQPPLKVCECQKYNVVKGPYPSGFCLDCGYWYPPKGHEESQAVGAEDANDPVQF
jgi:hypothetical protein